MSEEDRRPKLGNPQTFEELAARVAILEALAFGANVCIVDAHLQASRLPQARQHIQGLAQLTGYAQKALDEPARAIANTFAVDILGTLSSIVDDAEAAALAAEKKSN